MMIPNPMRIACTECHRDAHIEFQGYQSNDDTIVVAAECDCGRVLALVDGLLISRGYGSQQQPIIASSLRHDADLGTHAKERIQALRERISYYERWIAAATWARDKLRPT
jgi:hypothetical protein